MPANRAAKPAIIPERTLYDHRRLAGSSGACFMRALQLLHTAYCAMNIRVRDVRATYQQWRSRGGEFLSPPKDHQVDIRCYLRDPDGYLIEVGQGTGILEQMGRRAPH